MQSKYKVVLQARQHIFYKWANKTNVYATKARWVPIYKHMCINRFCLLCDRFFHRFSLGFWLVFEVCCVVVLQEINQFLHKQALAPASLYTNKHLHTHVYTNKPVYGLFFPPINLYTNTLLQLQTLKATHNFTQKLLTHRPFASNGVAFNNHQMSIYITSQYNTPS